MRGRLSHARASCVSRCASGNASSPARPGPLMCCSCSSDNTQQGHGRWSTDVVNSFRIWTGSPSCSCARDNFRPTTNTLLVYEGCLHGINSRSRLQVLSKKKVPKYIHATKGLPWKIHCHLARRTRWDVSAWTFCPVQAWPYSACSDACEAAVVEGRAEGFAHEPRCTDIVGT